MNDRVAMAEEGCTFRLKFEGYRIFWAGAGLQYGLGFFARSTAKLDNRPYACGDLPNHAPFKSTR